MSTQSRLVAGIVLIIVPTVEIGGASILSLLIGDPQYGQRTTSGKTSGEQPHAHAGVWLVLSLVALRYVDEATLSEGIEVGGAPRLPGSGGPDGPGLLPLCALP
jgi:hypothetical protein